MPDDTPLVRARACPACLSLGPRRIGPYRQLCDDPWHIVVPPGITPTCRVEYVRPGGRQHGDRIVQCNLYPEHTGNHMELTDGEVANEWPTVRPDPGKPFVIRHRTPEERQRHLEDEVVRLTGKANDYRTELRKAQSDLLDVRGLLSPNGHPRKVPMEIADRVAPAVAWLLEQLAETRTLLDGAKARVLDSALRAQHAEAERETMRDEALNLNALVDYLQVRAETAEQERDAMRPVVEAALGEGDTATEPHGLSLVDATRLLYAFFDAWWNKVGCYDPGHVLISDGAVLTDIASLLTQEDSDRLDAAAEAIGEHDAEIRALLGVATAALASPADRPRRAEEATPKRMNGV